LAAARSEKALLDDIFRNYPFRAPEILVRHELESELRSYVEDQERHHHRVPDEEIQRLAAARRPHAEWRVKRQLLLDWIALQEHIEASAEEVDAELARLGRRLEPAAAEDPPSAQEKALKQFIRHEIQRRKAVDLVRGAATMASEV
jgi:FKBP-type peptidyl-prolyl cis-trans isomerase (trigger factor)